MEYSPASGPRPTPASRPPDVYAVVRNDRSAPLSSPYAAFWVNGKQHYPSLVGYSKYLYFEDVCYGIVGYDLLCYVEGDGGTFVSTGNTGAVPSFSGPEGYDYFHGYVTADAGSYYFVSRLEPDGGFTEWSWGDQNLQPDAAPRQQAIFSTHQAGPKLDSFGADPVEVAADSTLFLDNPVLSFDELGLYVSATTANDPIPHVLFASRATTSDAFGPLTPVHELDSPEGEYPSWLSPDGCRLYLTRVVGGQRDLYVASRSE